MTYGFSTRFVLTNHTATLQGTRPRKRYTNKLDRANICQHVVKESEVSFRRVLRTLYSTSVARFAVRSDYNITSIIVRIVALSRVRFGHHRTAIEDGLYDLNRGSNRAGMSNLTSGSTIR